MASTETAYLSSKGRYTIFKYGDTILQEQGILSDKEKRKIQEFIKERYKDMYPKWSEYSTKGYYQGKK